VVGGSVAPSFIYFFSFFLIQSCIGNAGFVAEVDDLHKCSLIAVYKQTNTREGCNWDLSAAIPTKEPILLSIQRRCLDSGLLINKHLG